MGNAIAKYRILIIWGNEAYMSLKSQKIHTNLSEAEFKELREARRNIFFFSKHIKVVSTQLGKVPFNLYPYQTAVVWAFLNYKFNIIKKFRQAGLTELIAMYCLWFAMYHDHKNVLIISIKDRVAKKVLRRIKFMYKNLPDHLKVPIVNGRGDDLGTASELEFSNGSLISSQPTTEDVGRSEAVSLLVVDEAAILRWMSKIWAAIWPTLSTGGRAIVNSTPYGVGNWYHNIWVNACARGNVFNPINLKWQMHPDRDEKWYRDQLQVLGPRRTAQEIDGDFLASGYNVFDLSDLRAIEDAIEEIYMLETEMNDMFRLYKEPKRNGVYYIGEDVSTGRANDYSAFSVMDGKGEEYASFKGRVPTNVLADLTMRTGKKFNDALLAPEINDVGEAVVSRMQDEGYPYLYNHIALIKNKGDKKPKEEKRPGWLTTSKIRPIIINELEEDIRLRDIYLKNQEFVREGYTFIYDSSNKPVAMGKGNQSQEDDALEDETYTDDSIMATAITNHIRKRKFNQGLILPK